MVNATGAVDHSSLEDEHQEISCRTDIASAAARPSNTEIRRRVFVVDPTVIFRRQLERS